MNSVYLKILAMGNHSPQDTCEGHLGTLWSVTPPSCTGSEGCGEPHKTPMRGPDPPKKGPEPSMKGQETASVVGGVRCALS